MAEHEDEKRRIVKAIQDVAKESPALHGSETPVGDERADAALQWLRNERRLSQEKLDRAASV